MLFKQIMIHPPETLSIFLENLTTVLEQNIDFFSMFVAWNEKYASSQAPVPIGGC